jgi:hypothetical protein
VVFFQVTPIHPLPPLGNIKILSGINVYSPKAVFSILVYLLDNCLVQFLCSLKVHRCNVGIAEKNVFVTCNLPAWERKVDVVTNLLSHFKMRGRQSLTLGFVVPKGRHK